MAVEGLVSRDIYIRDVFRAAWELLTHRGLAIAIGSFLLVGPGLSLINYLAGDASATLGPVGRLASSELRGIIQGVLQGVAAAWAMLLAADELRRDKTSSLALATRLASHLPAVAACAAVSQIAIVLGCLALLVPGVLIGLMWAVVIQALVAEDLTVGQAFRRSRQLTAGRRSAIFGLQLIVGIGCVAINLGLILLVGGGASIQGALTHPDVRFFWWPLFVAGENVVVCAINAALYLQLADGSTTSATAEVFG